MPNKMNIEQFRSLTPEQRIEKIKGTREERVFSFEREHIDVEARTAWMTISSEREYERWFGLEILDHKSESIDTERLESGAPILVGHDRDDHVGVVERFEITKEKKLRILARFGRSARADDVFQDVIDGIRVNTSVGYMINDLILEKDGGDQLSTYRVKSWTPFEGSLVSVPADPTTGVGRSDDELNLIKEEIEMSDKKDVQTKQDAKVDTTAPRVDESAIAQRELQRVNEILAAGDEFKDMGGVELAREMAKSPSSTVDGFKAKMLEKMKAKQVETKTAEPADLPNQNIDIRYRFNSLKAFNDVTLENGTKMAAEEAAHRSGQWLLATVYGNEKAAKYCKDHGIGNMERVMGGNSLTGGGAVIPVEMEQAIIDLRDTYGAARQLARIRPMSSDALTIPKRTGGLSAYFFDDEDGTGLTESDKSWGQVQLVAKKLGVLSRISKDMVEDAIINVVDDLASEMAYAFSLKEDQIFIDGDSTSTSGGMTGFRPLFDATAYLSRIDLTSGTNTFLEVDADDLAQVMAGVATYARPGAVWVCSETAKALLFDRLAAASGGTTMTEIGGAPRSSYLGHQIVTSEAMPSTAAADLNNQVMFTFGRFDLSTSIGARRGIEIEILRERYAEFGQLGIIGTERFDIVTHDLGDTTTKGPVAAAYGNT